MYGQQTTVRAIVSPIAASRRLLAEARCIAPTPDEANRPPLLVKGGRRDVLVWIHLGWIGALVVGARRRFVPGGLPSV